MMGSKFVSSLGVYSINKIVDPDIHGLNHMDGLIIVDKSTTKNSDLRFKLILYIYIYI